MLKTGEIANWIIVFVVLKTLSKLHYVLYMHVDVKYRKSIKKNTGFKSDALR